MNESDNKQGACTFCGEPNDYNATNCHACGTRLPWADALEAARRAAGANGANDAHRGGRTYDAPNTAESVPRASAQRDNMEFERDPFSADSPDTRYTDLPPGRITFGTPRVGCLILPCGCLLPLVTLFLSGLLSFLFQ